MAQRRTRLAPSPTGSLHLGNARTFVLTWALARNEGWEVVLRIEDLDGPRVRPGAVDEAIAVLSWLGLDWDGPIRRQSDDLAPFADAMRRLGDRVFRCERSRKDVRSAASAPHAEDGEVRFPPSLRPIEAERRAFDEPLVNYRLLVEPGADIVVDELLGTHSFDPGMEIGDFLVWTKAGVPAYQLAVVVDDIAQGITDVVRGDDLLASAARQQMLYRAFERPAPRWWHLPLVHDGDGHRLAKRHDDLSLASLRAAGVRRERVLGLLARWCGFVRELVELDLDGFRSLVSPATLRALAAREHAPGGRCSMQEDDRRWLSSI
jgi:glutamyl-tRNA synthetase